MPLTFSEGFPTPPASADSRFLSSHTEHLPHPPSPAISIQPCTPAIHPSLPDQPQLITFPAASPLEELAVSPRIQCRHQPGQASLARPAKSQPSSLFLAQNSAQHPNNNALPSPEKSTLEPISTPPVGVKASKRRVSPTESRLMEYSLSPQNKFAWAHHTAHDCARSFSESDCSRALSQSVAKVHEDTLWAYHEFFYCEADRDFFAEEANNFTGILTTVGWNPHDTCFDQYLLLHEILPKPVLLTCKFLLSQLTRLQRFRKLARSRRIYQQSQGQSPSFFKRRVYAVHPLCGHIHAGTILPSPAEPHYSVQFDRPEWGVQRVLDFDVSAIDGKSIARQLAVQADLPATALLVELLKLRSELSHQLDEVSLTVFSPGGLRPGTDPQLVGDWQWLLRCLEILQPPIRQTLSRFRLRLPSSFPARNEGRDALFQTLEKHYSEILVKPLEVLREREAEFQHEDLARRMEDIQRALHRIKKVLNHTQAKVKACVDRQLQKWKDPRSSQHSPPFEHLGPHCPQGQSSADLVNPNRLCGNHEHDSQASINATEPVCAFQVSGHRPHTLKVSQGSVQQMPAGHSLENPLQTDSQGQTHANEAHDMPFHEIARLISKQDAVRAKDTPTFPPGAPSQQVFMPVISIPCPPNTANASKRRSLGGSSPSLGPLKANVGPSSSFTPSQTPQSTLPFTYKKKESSFHRLDPAVPSYPSTVKEEAAGFPSGISSHPQKAFEKCAAPCTIAGFGTGPTSETAHANRSSKASNPQARLFPFRTQGRCISHPAHGPLSNKAQRQNSSLPKECYPESSELSRHPSLDLIPPWPFQTNSSTSIKAWPANTKSWPASLKAQPVSFKSQPASVKAQPVGFKSQPASVKLQPTSVRSQLVHINIQPVSIESEPNQGPPAPNMNQSSAVSEQGQSSEHISPAAKETMTQLVECCLGILASLRTHSEDYCLEECFYVQRLITLVDPISPEHFNAIFEQIRSLIRPGPSPE